MKGETLQQLSATARKTVDQKTFGFLKQADRRLEAATNRPKFSSLTVGRVLGKGGFCQVCAIVQVGAEHRWRGDRRYVLKELHAKAQSQPESYVNGMADLAMEAKMLSVLRHDNIVSLHSVANASPYDPSFFVVLERLDRILDKQLTTWAQREQVLLPFQKRNAFRQRLVHATGIASALSYLHGMSVLYRDLKPDNIGIDANGVVKLFDFGLAKPVNNVETMKNHTADTGSGRYMAPEVALGKPYNCRSDVYSFALLLWQILALQIPFVNYVRKDTFHYRIYELGVRPKIPQGWADSLQRLLAEAWSPDPKLRPAMTDILDVLELQEDNIQASNSAVEVLENY